MGPGCKVPHDLYSTAVSDDEFPRDSQAQTTPLQATSMDVLALIKPVENPVVIFGRNSWTRISHVKRHLVPHLSQRQRNHTLIRRVFDRIGDQIRRDGA